MISVSFFNYTENLVSMQFNAYCQKLLCLILGKKAFYLGWIVLQALRLGFIAFIFRIGWWSFFLPRITKEWKHRSDNTFFWFFFLFGWVWRKKTWFLRNSLLDSILNCKWTQIFKRKAVTPVILKVSSIRIYDFNAN